MDPHFQMSFAQLLMNYGVIEDDGSWPFLHRPIGHSSNCLNQMEPNGSGLFSGFYPGANMKPNPNDLNPLSQQANWLGVPLENQEIRPRVGQSIPNDPFRSYVPFNSGFGSNRMENSHHLLQARPPCSHDTQPQRLHGFIDSNQVFLDLQPVPQGPNGTLCYPSIQILPGESSLDFSHFNSNPFSKATGKLNKTIPMFTKPLQEDLGSFGSPIDLGKLMKTKDNEVIGSIGGDPKLRDQSLAMVRIADYNKLNQRKEEMTEIFLSKMVHFKHVNPTILGISKMEEGMLSEIFQNLFIRGGRDSSMSFGQMPVGPPRNPLIFDPVPVSFRLGSFLGSLNQNGNNFPEENVEAPLEKNGEFARVLPKEEAEEVDQLELPVANNRSPILNKSLQDVSRLEMLPEVEMNLNAESLELDYPVENPETQFSLLNHEKAGGNKEIKGFKGETRLSRRERKMNH